MTAGRGIVHSEMPEQENGLLMGFQLWINLPAAEKMTAPSYQEFAAAEIPVETLDGGGTVKVIAGETNQGTVGPAHRPATDPLYFDVELPGDGTFEQRIPVSHQAVLYVIDGSAQVGAQNKPIASKTLGVLSEGDDVRITADGEGVRFLLIAGRRLNEPVARGGPFVMNTKQEILQAFSDYQNNRFGG
jgi:redox-sensitive bicupin YhaK (pirin superfamily)